MKLWYLLDEGDIIVNGDECFVYGRWTPSAHIGKPVVRGAFRRAAEDSGAVDNIAQQAQPKMPIDTMEVNL